jgi:hypothetical protein
MICDFTYEWTDRLAANGQGKQYGKLLQFIGNNDTYAMMLRTDGRIEKVRYNFLQAVGDFVSTGPIAKTLDSTPEIS